jgi:hypothetical protein
MNGRERKEKRRNSQRRTSGYSIIYFFISVIRPCFFFIMTECHLYKLIQIESKADDDTTSDESDVEVVSIVDETDTVPTLINDHFDSDDNEEHHINEEPPAIRQSCLASKLNDMELDESADNSVGNVRSMDQSLSAISSSNISNLVEESPSCKSKRRQWTTAEKLRAIHMLEKAGGNKRLTSQQQGCSRYQLLQWIKQKEDLIQLSKQNHGEFFLISDITSNSMTNLICFNPDSMFRS